MSKKKLANPLRRRKPAVQVELDLPPPAGAPGAPEVVELEPEWWQAKWFVGLLAGRTQKVATLEELDAATAQGWAGEA